MSTTLRALAGALKTAIDAAQRALGFANVADVAAKAAAKAAQEVGLQKDAVLTLSSAATEAATTATTQAGLATTQAGIATTKAGEAVAAKDAAVLARDASFALGPKYADEPTGRVAVADNATFLVQGSGDVAALEYRRINAGASTLIASYPSAGAVTANKDAVAVLQGMVTKTPVDPTGALPVLMDADGRMLIWVDTSQSGKVRIPGLSDVTDANAAGLTSLNSVVSPTLPTDPATGMVPMFQDADGRILIGCDVRTGRVVIPYATITDLAGAAEVLDSLLPSDPRLLVSDYAAIGERSGSRLRFLRPIVDGQGYEHCSPGTRVGIVTNAKTVVFRVYYNFLVTRRDLFNSVGVVLVDGVVNRTFTSTSGTSGASQVDVTVTFGSAAVRKVELVWPYLDGMDLLEVQVSRGAGVALAPARPTGRLVVAGDSITHGMSATNVGNTWAHKLAESLGMQLVNLGYGGRRATATDGTAAGQASPTKALYMIGYNNYSNQTALATFRAAVKSYAQNFRAQAPTVPLWLITPLYASAAPSVAGPITLQEYRDQIISVYNELSVADANLHLADGLSLMTNSNTRLNGDLVHPNDTGAAEVAANLALIV